MNTLNDGEATSARYRVPVAPQSSYGSQSSTTVDGVPWLIVIGEREGLRWVIEHQRMAFRDTVKGKPSAGDPFAIYVSRGAFHNPGRDEAQVLGLGTFKTGIERRATTVGDERYARTARLDISEVRPERQGLPFRPLVEDLTFIAKKSGWAAYVRQTLVPIPQADFDLIARRLREFPKPLSQ